MIQEAIQYIVGLSGPSINEIGNGIYSDKKLTRIENPLARARTVTTLSAFVRYLIANRDGLNMEELLVHVVSPSEVDLISTLNADSNRETYLVAKADIPVFRFGVFYDSESFNIAMQSMFVDAGHRAEIIRMSGNLIDESTKTSTDDGKTQSVVVRTGVKVLGRETVPNPVELSPYRTFIEVEQPVSKFVFRAKEGGQLALFEADGGAWRNVAMLNIAEYLNKAFREANIEVTILA